MLDTNVIVEMIRRHPPVLIERLRAHPVGSVSVSSITVAELYYGVARSADPAKNAMALTHVLVPLVVLDFDGTAAIRYGTVRHQLERAGTPVGPLDTLIASHALSLDITMVTSNVGEFGRVRGLRVEDWARPQ
jgi:tRNA(fMet)-specific endonuclease VapC